MPPAHDLPDPIKALSRRHAIEVSDSRWNYDVGLLIDRLRDLIPPTRERLPLTQTQQELHQMQLRYFDMLRSDTAGALELAQKTQALLDHVSPLYPQDRYLRLVRGYCHKNEAMALRDLGRRREFETSLEAADQVFNNMTQENPDDAGAWNGRGSVEALRGNFKDALAHIDRALAIDPDYDAAKRDRQEVLKRMNK